MKLIKMPSQFPDWLVWYKQPSFVDVNQFASSFGDKSGTASNPTTPRCNGEVKRNSCDIPSKLSLERILKNRTCSPMSLYDFYMYLKYIEHSAENLEFYVWFKNYDADRLTAFSKPPRAVTPLSSNDSVSEKSLVKPENDEKLQEPMVLEAEAEAAFNFDDSEIYAKISALITPSCAPCSLAGASQCAVGSRAKRKFSLTDQAGADEAGKTSTEIQDMRRSELDTIRTLFLLPGAPKELNIPASMQRKVLDALATSTEASHLAPVAEHCYLLLRSCSHRNFIRLGVSNGSFETICMATGLGIFLTLAGFLALLLLAFHAPAFKECSRWKGLGVWPIWSIGAGLILSGIRGSCFFLLLFSRRQPLPWEQFEDDPIVPNKSAVVRLLSRLMIFDRKLKVKDDNLRRLQRKLVAQSLLGGMGFATLMIILFLGLPIWRKL